MASESKFQTHIERSTQYDHINIDMEHPSGDYIMQVLGDLACFNDERHSQNFVRYLFRQGAEKPNVRTSENLLMIGDIGPVSADGRTNEQMMVPIVSLFSKLNDQWRNEIIHFMRPDGMRDGFDAQTCLDAYLGLHEHLGLRAGWETDVLVVHMDQVHSPHLHRVFLGGARRSTMNAFLAKYRER